MYELVGVCRAHRSTGGAYATDTSSRRRSLPAEMLSDGVGVGIYARVISAAAAPSAKWPPSRPGLPANRRTRCVRQFCRKCPRRVTGAHIVAGFGEDRPNSGLVAILGEGRERPAEADDEGSGLHRFRVRSGGRGCRRGDGRIAVGAGIIGARRREQGGYAESGGEGDMLSDHAAEYWPYEMDTAPRRHVRGATFIQRSDQAVGSMTRTWAQ